MALKWTKDKHASWITCGHMTIYDTKDGFVLKVGWNFICMLKTEAGCKRVANCIARECEKDKNRVDNP